MHWKGWDTRGSKSELAGEEDVESLKELVLQDRASEELLIGWQHVRDAGTPNPESSTCLPSSHCRSCLLTCVFLHPAQPLWSGGHFPLEAEGVTLAVCDGRGSRGGRMAGLLLQAATKEQWAAPALGPQGDRPWGGNGSLWVPAHGVSLPAVGIEGRAGRRKPCQIQIRTELLSSSLPMEEAKEWLMDSILHADALVKMLSNFSAGDPNTVSVLYSCSPIYSLFHLLQMWPSAFCPFLLFG